jgi:hypothetical protein
MKDSGQYAIPNKDFCETLAGHMLHLLIWEKVNTNPNVAEVIRVVKEAMKADKGYFETWKANIAVAFQDAAFAEVSADPEIRDRIHKISNTAAESFLNRFINN